MEDGTVWACGSNNYNQLGMTGADADVLCLYGKSLSSVLRAQRTKSISNVSDKGGLTPLT